jgi:hypothetical protein
MAKIDRLGWVAGISFRVCGLRLGVRVSDRRILSRVIEILPPGWTKSESPYVDMLYSFVVGGEVQRAGTRRFNLVYLDSARLARTPNVDAALHALEMGLEFYVSTEARRRLFVHAGVVGWDGKAIVIPGKSTTGKTTLVAELVKRGATYFSDEHAVFDARGRVHPYPKPLEINSPEAGMRLKTPVADLGGTVGTKPLPVGLILSSEYRKGAQWRVRELSRGKGVLALLAHASSARHRPELALATLQQVVANARVVQGVRGEASEAAGIILEELTSR